MMRAIPTTPLKNSLTCLAGLGMLVGTLLGYVGGVGGDSGDVCGTCVG